MPASWLAGASIVGSRKGLVAKGAGQQRGIGYVLAVARDHQVRTGIGKRRAVDLAVRLPTGVWQRHSAGSGAKGHRLYDWALVDIDEPDTPGCHWLLIRRSRRTGELAFYRCYAPTPVPLITLVQVAGRRWTVEESFQTGKGLAGLDEHQVRRWTSWHRWSVLAMLAHAFLAVIATVERTRTRQPRGLIPLTLGEIRHLFTSLHNRRPHDPTHLLHCHDGDAATKPEHAPATTAAKPPRSHDHDLRLEF